MHMAFAEIVASALLCSAGGIRQHQFSVYRASSFQFVAVVVPFFHSTSLFSTLNDALTISVSCHCQRCRRNAFAIVVLSSAVAGGFSPVAHFVMVQHFAVEWLSLDKTASERASEEWFTRKCNLRHTKSTIRRVNGMRNGSKTMRGTTEMTETAMKARDLPYHFPIRLDKNLSTKVFNCRQSWRCEWMR